MKRLINALLLLAFGCFCSLQAETYSIVFNSSNSDSSTPTKTLYEVVLSASDNMVISLPVMNKIYRAKAGYGIKGGTASAKGELTLQLDGTYHPTQLTIYAAAWGSDSKPIIVCGQSVSLQQGEIQPYTVNLNTSSGLSSIDIVASEAKNNRFYIQKIEFTCPDPMPTRAKIEAPYRYTFPSTPYIAGDTIEDMDFLPVSARSVTGEGLAISLKKGSVFSLLSASLPADGGEIAVSYSATTPGTFLDTLEVRAHGSDDIIVTRQIPIQVTSYTYVPKTTDSTGMVVGPFAASYYLPAQGLADSALKSTLGHIVNTGIRYRYGSGKNHTWEGFFYTDRDTTNNLVLDMYSDNLRYFNPERPTASVEGFDIEHMLPKSWWGGIVNDAYQDLFHLVPGDFSANRSKSNHAPGIPADTTFWNGSFAVGTNSLYPADKVFCPSDEYKGDFARAYFYIATCYGDTLTWVEEASSEAATAMTNNSYLEFRPWLQQVLIAWHRLDPVSEKEKNRATEVNRLQGNRNPFIDYPDLVEYIWGNRQGQTVDFSQLVASYPETPTDLEAILQEDAPQKILLNGHLRIIIDSCIYDASGQRLR